MTTSRRSKSIEAQSNQQEPTSRRSFDSRRRHKASKNAAEANVYTSNGSSCRIFEKRTSSSCTDVETARFPKIDGLPSSRRYPEDSPRPHLPTGNSHKKGSNSKNSKTAYKTYTPKNYPKPLLALERKPGTDRSIRYNSGKPEAEIISKPQQKSSKSQKDRIFVKQL
jgi:hypothetical protein